MIEDFRPKMPICLRAVRIAAQRGAHLIFSDVSFSLVRSDILIISGQNGSGKSTLLRMILGFIPCQSGYITFENNELATIRSSSHYIGHENSMKSDLSVEENLIFWKSFSGGNGMSVKEALDRVGLDRFSSLSFSFLSAGQKKRLNLARLFLFYRPIWILDEPISSLDCESQDLVVQCIEEHQKNGGISVIAAHPPFSLKGAQLLKIGNHV